MFKVRNAKNELPMVHQLAHIVALLGPPPADFVKGNDTALKYFHVDGECLTYLYNLGNKLLTNLAYRILERNCRNPQDQP